MCPCVRIPCLCRGGGCRCGRLCTIRDLSLYECQVCVLSVCLRDSRVCVMTALCVPTSGLEALGVFPCVSWGLGAQDDVLGCLSVGEDLRLAHFIAVSPPNPNTRACLPLPFPA